MASQHPPPATPVARAPLDVSEQREVAFVVADPAGGAGAAVAIEDDSLALLGRLYRWAMTEPDVDFAALRRAYDHAGLDAGDLDADPLRQAAAWLRAAVAAGEPEPNAMVLATVDADGTPAVRTVLCKGVDARGVTFFSNYTSRKASHLAGNPSTAVVFTWLRLHRQLALQGAVERLDAAESDTYFASRPRGSQLGAWASQQSATIGSREALEAQLAEVAARFDGREVPRPDFWGGYLLRPVEVECWQGRSNRLHDRLVYVRDGDAWHMERRQP